MRFRHVERGKIVPVVLDLGTAGDGKAHVGENLGQFVHDLADRMDAALGARARAAKGRPFRPQGAHRARRLEPRATIGKRGRHRFARGMDARAFALAFLGLICPES
jgi:hypothetical protein